MNEDVFPIEHGGCSMVNFKSSDSTWMSQEVSKWLVSGLSPQHTPS